MMKQYTKPMLAIYKLNAQALMANIDSITESECRKNAGGKYKFNELDTRAYCTFP